ncbi:methanogenesis marker protein 17 [Methanofollis liminatans DSM 4140]|jgi:putative methanogenesis marker protein 17|uniref:Methanogenesis marker protein 17 n=1 Tax=Methanofollis liminatans DSM 4140 TaxID=28892 RepID=J0RXY4_9EURY|nr:methanogenesis marker 17 protein [Methanofollis liminatans]EJG06366.1 methanogenesis marker protein 17 [Methanofollis liminatans DSM 4140]
MAALEYFTVECVEEKGREVYEQIASDVLLDLDLLRVVEKLHIFIDPRVPVFVAVGTTRRSGGLVRIRDFADVIVEEGRATLSIGDETYLAPMLSILWGRYGKDSIDQPDRFSVVVHLPEGEDPREIEEIVVADPEEGLYRDLIYALQIVAPEGFKVRRQYHAGGVFYYVASENTLPQEIVDTLVAEKLNLIGVTL